MSIKEKNAIEALTRYHPNQYGFMCQSDKSYTYCQYFAVEDVLAALAPPPLPVALLELNDDLRDILGRPNFTCISIAHRLREMGHTIKNRAEHEQAATIYLMLAHYLQHGAFWRDTVNAYLARSKPADDQNAPAANPISSDHGTAAKTTTGETSDTSGGLPG